MKVFLLPFTIYHLPMSKLFYDHLIFLSDLEIEIKSIAETEEERHELWQIVDEIIHHRILEFFLDKLAEEHHDGFLEKYSEAPHDESHLQFLNERIEGEIEELIREEVDNLASEILREIRIGANTNE